MRFHRRCGDRVTLLNDNSTAIRNFVEFNHGLILSAEPLKDDVLFEICIDRKVNVWNGSLEIGVTTLDPEYMELPATATKLRNTAWIMSGSSIVKDGVTVINSYGPELDTLREGDCLGVMRTTKAELMFYINGRCIGLAARDLPARVFAVIDLYGQCVQVSITHTNGMRPIMESSLDQIEEDPNNDDTLTPSEMDVAGALPDTPPKDPHSVYIPMTSEGACALAQDRLRFHPRCGILVKLSNNNKSAERARPLDDYNNGVVMTHRPLADNELFEIRIDRLVDKWSGSIEVDIGISLAIHIIVNVHRSAVRARPLDDYNNGVVMTHRSLADNELFEIRIGRLVDKWSGSIEVNIGISLTIHIIVYVHRSTVRARPLDDYNNGVVMTHRSLADNELFEIRIGRLVDKWSGSIEVNIGISLTIYIIVYVHRSTVRARPLDDYNNGVVMTHRPLADNELFEIRIDRLVDKWSGSIEVGVTTHNPATIRFPSTMTNMDTGTIMMSGCKVLLNGHGTCMEYGNFNLDELREGDTVGMMRKSDGKLHYFINGVDQGVATDKVEPQVWGVVDLYGMTVKVSIVDPCEDVDSNIGPPSSHSTPVKVPSLRRLRTTLDEHTLLFHTLRDSNVIIINDGKTAHRPNAFEYFNNGIVMTNRTLRTGELFQVRLDLVITKWAGSIEIGVTQHSSNDIKFPFKMSNAKSGTWAMTGEDVIRDGSIIIPQYVRNLNRLVEGDTVGVMRKDMGILHFFVNGIDQGPAAFNIPEHVFGIIDLYGRVAQATIVDCYLPPPFSPESPLSIESNATIYPEMCFHRVHGRNAHLCRNRLTAYRGTVYSEFNDAVLFSSRPLRECDMFELRIDKMVDCWIGSLEIGVTAIRPDDFEGNGGVGAVAGTATDLNWDTYILSGAAMMKDGECVRSGYPLDLDTLTVGSRVGMMWHADRSLHYYLDGMDMGKAWYVPHLNIYAVVDLYGQCTQVTILQNEERAFNYNGCTNSDNTLMSNYRMLSSPPPPYWSFSEYCGDNICLMHDYSFARRLTPDPMGALVFSSAHLAIGEIFEIKVVECKYGFAGSFRMGVTDINILNAHVNRSFPPSVSYLPHYTAYVDGKYIKYSKTGSREHEVYTFVPSFEWLRPGDRIGLKKTTDGRVLIYYNSELVDTAFEKVPDKVYVIIEITGHVTKIQAVSRNILGNAFPQSTIPNDECTKTIQPVMNNANSVCNSTGAVQPNNGQLEPSTSQSQVNEAPIEPISQIVCEEPTPVPEVNDSSGTTAGLVTTETRRKRHPLPYTFHYLHGRNIKLCSSDTVALRTSGFQDAIAIVSTPLRRGHNFRFRVDKMEGEWYGSVSIGALGALPSEPLPPSAMNLEPPVWVIASDLLKDNGTFITTEVAAALEDLHAQSVLAIHFRFNNELVVEIDGEVVGAIGYVPRSFGHVFPLIDLYGRVQQVSVLLHPCVVASGTSLDLPIITENLREESLAELEQSNDAAHRTNNDNVPEKRIKKKTKAYSQDNLVDDHFEPIVQPGPSSHPDPPIVSSLPKPESETNKTVKDRKVPQKRLSLHHSLILSENSIFPVDSNENANRSLQKSHSTHNFCQVEDNNSEYDVKVPIRHTYSAGSHIGEEADDITRQQEICDTNIRHNDRYPEANDVDNLDNEIMDALTLETGNLPDLTEEQSSSIDESTRRDDFWPEPLSAENLNYLNRILCFDQDGTEGQSLESEWEATGEGCEHLHLVLKYWNFLVLPYPELRQAVSWGQVRCYCSNCQPEAQSHLSGWVRIERIDGVGAARRAFWHVVRSTLGSAQAAGDEAGPTRRPRALLPAPCAAPPLTDIWFDEEGKPHHTVLAIEIDVEGSEAENDRLLAFLIYLKSHVVFIDDNSPSLEE